MINLSSVMRSYVMMIRIINSNMVFLGVVILIGFFFVVVVVIVIDGGSGVGFSVMSLNSVIRC